MKGIIGAATVVGCLQHGVGSSLLVELKASSLAGSRDDADFLAALRHSARQESSLQPLWWSCITSQRQAMKQ